VEIVSDLKNFFVERIALGGAGGIASMQIERSMDVYIEKERENNLHFLVIGNKMGERETDLDYFAKGDSTTHVFHAASAIESPVANRWSTYLPETFKVEEGKLIIDRHFKFNIKATLIMMFYFVVTIPLALLLNFIFSLSLKYIYLKMFL
jgi:hypothetical protein